MPAVELDGRVFIPGGFGGERRLEIYDPANDAWSRGSDLPAGRHHLMAAALDGRLYVFGGGAGLSWTPTDGAWVYDPATDTWKELEPLPEPRLAGAAVALDGRLYIVGGIGGSGATLAYNPDNARWESLLAPARQREHVAAATLAGEIWLLGGRWQGVGEQAAVEILDLTDRTWREGPMLIVPRAGFAAAADGGRIVVAGGEVIMTGRDTLGSIEVLLPGAEAWSLGPPIPFPVHGVGGAIVDSRFFLMGGSDREGAIANAGRVQILDLTQVGD
jgi:hypothetical protein